MWVNLQRHGNSRAWLVLVENGAATLKVSLVSSLSLSLSLKHYYLKFVIKNLNMKLLCQLAFAFVDICPRKE